MSLKVVFAGTPQFAVPSLSALLDSELELLAVYTQPDRPAGRGRSLQASPVKQLAMQHNIAIYQPTSLKDNDAQQQLARLRPDVMVVVAYGMLLPQAVLDIPRLGCINIHPSLLPRWRGTAPIQYALLAGDETTGVSIMQLDRGMDSGDILQQVGCAISDEDSSQTLNDKLWELGARLLLDTLSQMEHNTHHAMPQDHSKATYTKKITKQDAKLDWQSGAIKLHNQIRAYIPWPVAETLFNGKRLRIWQSKVVDRNDLSCVATPGTIIAMTDAGIDVATGAGILRVLKLQLPGKRQVLAKDFLNAHRSSIIVGETKLLSIK